MSDDELLAAELEARRKAHDAPMNPFRKNANGHKWVDQQSSAWSSRSREWEQLRSEVKARGLTPLTPYWDGDSRR